MQVTAMQETAVREDSGQKVAPVPVPELPSRPTWSGETDRRPEAGPMYPDLFEQAVAGTSLANVVTVNYADGEVHTPTRRPDDGRRSR